jgi:hypothetical protein
MSVELAPPRSLDAGGCSWHRGTNAHTPRQPAPPLERAACGARFGRRHERSYSCVDLYLLSGAAPGRAGQIWASADSRLPSRWLLLLEGLALLHQPRSRGCEAKEAPFASHGDPASIKQSSGTPGQQGDPLQMKRCSG